MSVVITATQGGDWQLPEDGSYLAVLADVIFLGPVATQYGVKDKVQLTWLLEAYDEEGNQFRVSSFYNANLHEKSNLRKDMKSIAGFDVGETYDIEEQLGAVNQLVIQQSVSGEKTYANVVAILKAPKGKTLEIPADFERKIDRDGVGSTERPVNSAPGKKAATKPRPQQAAAPAQRQQVQQAVQAPAKQTQARRPAPAPVQAEEPVYEEAAAVEEAPAPVAPVRQTRTLPPTAAAPAPANRAGTIRRAAPAPAAPVAEAPIADEDIPF